MTALWVGKYDRLFDGEATTVEHDITMPPTQIGLGNTFYGESVATDYIAQGGLGRYYRLDSDIRRHTLRWMVTVSSSWTGPKPTSAEVADSNVHPNQPFLGQPHPYDTDAFCKQITATPHNTDSGDAFIVVATYDNLKVGGRASDAVYRPPAQNQTFVRFRKQIETDLNGDRIVNVVGDRMDGAAIDEYRLVINYERFERPGQFTTYNSQQYINAINNSAFNQYPAYTVRCTSINATFVWDVEPPGAFGVNRYYRVAYQFMIRQDVEVEGLNFLEGNFTVPQPTPVPLPGGTGIRYQDWRQDGQLLNQGYQEIRDVDGTPTLFRAKDGKGQPVSKPLPLSFGGQFLDPPPPQIPPNPQSEPPYTYLDFKFYKELDFNALQIQLM